MEVLKTPPEGQAGTGTEQEREALRRDILAGCATMWDIYLEMAQAYEPLEAEAAYAFYTPENP